MDQILDYFIIARAALNRRRRINRHILGRYRQKAKQVKKDVPSAAYNDQPVELLPMIVAEMKARNMHVVHLTVE